MKNSGLRLFGRLGGMVLVVWGAATVGFLALRLVPGDPVDVMLGVHAEVSERVRAEVRADWGLAEPPFVQYLAYLGRLLRGDLGTSYRLQSPVGEVIGGQLAPTVQLMALAMVFALLLALGSALLARGPRSKALLSLVELFAVSSPTFWTGLVLITVFGFGLGWFPVVSTEGLAALILPAVTLALPVAGIISQVFRQGLEAASALPFVETVRARGASHSRLVLRHTLRHAAANSITLTGYIVGSLLGGSVLVETVFARPGLGRVALNAIINRDIPIVLGIVVLAAVVFSVINLLVDLLYDRVDPRLMTAAVYS
ncbi:MAG: ABC transporter permease [Cryobacterium sp.]|uniref:ABC transporter permease n=1 Tax=unclassified Cryobacterium TaxID=2649013 RepID=UPI001A1A600F|nr:MULTISPECIES: ABC transporter permease [unclassified Cryobacterium]MCY7403456.1 ABC transporter permease [Cryobacterium sp.]MEC5152743.1 peptide/nickel transport system permease protein [Cryobacterium sp. CAN_C3]